MHAGLNKDMESPSQVPRIKCHHVKKSGTLELLVINKIPNSQNNLRFLTYIPHLVLVPPLPHSP